MDPLLHPLSSPVPPEPSRLLASYRQRLNQTPWAGQTRDTLLTPVWSTAASVARFESRLVLLFRAHLKVLHALQMGRGEGARWKQYARLQRAVRARYVDWPVLEARELPSPELLLAEEARELLYGRPDIVLAKDGPKVVETNFDTAIGGFERPDAIWEMAAALFSPPPEYLSTGRPLEGMRRYFAEAARGQPRRIHWIMKNDPEIRREVDPFIAALDQNPDGPRHVIHYAGETVPPATDDLPAWLHRSCSIFSVQKDRERFTHLLKQLVPQVMGCTVPVELSELSSKLYIAWLSDPEGRPSHLTSEEREAVDGLVPWTRVLTLLEGNELERVRRDRGEFILKKADSHQAKEVFFGCNHSADEWNALLETRLREPDVMGGLSNFWLVQERVHPQQYTLLEYTDAGPVERRTGLSCCPYVLGGRVRGLETWVTPATPDHEMINRMHFVAHFIRQPA